MILLLDASFPLEFDRACAHFLHDFGKIAAVLQNQTSPLDSGILAEIKRQNLYLVNVYILYTIRCRYQHPILWRRRRGQLLWSAATFTRIRFLIGHLGSYTIEDLALHSLQSRR